MPSCAHCGRELSAHDQHVRYQLPDELFGLPAEDKAKLVQDECGLANLVTYADRGFVRVLLPVHLDDDGSVTFGAWLEVERADFDRAASAWSSSTYRDLAFSGQLANALPRWGRETLGRRCRAEVLIDDEIPYVTATDDPMLRDVLTRKHDAAWVRAHTPNTAARGD